MDPAALSFTMLGRVTVRHGELTMPLARPRTQAVLAALLFAAGGPLSAAQLVDAVWGDELPGDAVASLRSHVRLLRRLIEPDRAPRTPSSILVSVGDGYELRVAPTAVDVRQAEELARSADNARAAGNFIQARELLGRALGLWHGEALAGVPGPAAAGQRQRLSELRTSLLEARLDVDLRLGRHDQVIGELAALSAEFPLRERLRGLWMAALYHCGRRSEALAVYAGTRRLLIDELGIEPGPELAELHQRILDDDPGLSRAESRSPANETPLEVGTSVRPAQLPRNVADFTGREAVVRELCETLVPTGSSAPIAIVIGMGGVGKTTLATHVAHAVQDRFPDGQLYADLHGMDERPADPVAVLGTFLRTLGVLDGDLPSAGPERAGLLRSLLADRRILLVLDNAGGLDQVIPLLPGGGGCAVLITSRAVLPLADATIRRLDVLSDGEARNLLGRIIGEQRIATEPEAAQAVVTACGRLPLAIRVIGARLAARPQWSIATVAGRLADEQRRLPELRCGDLAVDASFAFGYRQLDSATARAFVRLAVPALPDLSLAAAAAILGVTPAAAMDVCESLVDLGLLQSITADRYSYHDLLRLFARTMESRTDPEEVLARLLDYYLATAKTIVRQRYPGHSLDYVPATEHGGEPIRTAARAQAWLDAERAGLIALHRQIAAGHPDLVPASVDVAMLISETIDTSAQSGELAQALRQLLAVAEQRGVPDTEIRARLALGLVLALDLGRGAEAAIMLERAWDLLHPNGNRLLLGFAEHLLGAAAWGTGRDEDAIMHMAAAVELFRELGDPSWEGWACATLADRYGDAAQWDRVVETAERALRLAAELGGAAFDSLALGQLGRVALIRDRDPERALSLCTEGVRAARTHGRRLHLGWALFRLAQVGLHDRRFDVAEAAAAEAATVLAEAADPIRRGHALQFQAAALTGQGRIGEARAVRGRLDEFYTRIGLTPPPSDSVADSIAMATAGDQRN
ncbi:BTAD domain-containing putative transcriptional regulator [Nocardia sp. NPDC006044]|uniref:AfsR/SARP family transcriptional regulator n=1 Tax=Nocardia sp. NPDC006044 TaxID=3364306 RepID=UPI0036B6A804